MMSIMVLVLRVGDGRLSNPRGGACDNGTSTKLCDETTAATAADVDQAMHYDERCWWRVASSMGWFVFLV